MYASVTSATLVGVDARAVEVEAHVSAGKNRFILVGLPDTAVREAKERVRAAVASAGFSFPRRTVTVNLAPANLPKAGSAYDLPIALGVLIAAGVVAAAAPNVVALGELALDGSVRGVRGGLAAALVAAERGMPCLVPTACGAEAAVVDTAEVGVVASLADAVAAVCGTRPAPPPPAPVPDADDGPDLAVVRGQTTARRALEIAAAGAHHLFMIGPPGGGKTLLAQCLPGILPPLTAAESLEVARVWSAAGLVRAASRRPPYRSPHHSATAAALLGGGTGVPEPGELTLAHRGVLFMDEMGEFPAALLDALRQPLEDGVIRIARSAATVAFPCATQVVGATNPCPCGFAGDARRPCRCSAASVARYRRRLSGPLIDRFDLAVSLPRVDVDSLTGPPAEPSHEVRPRVERARMRQRHRGSANRDLDRNHLDTLDWDSDAVALLRKALARDALTGRGWDKVRRIAVTIADLEAASTIGEHHVAEALGYRMQW